MAGRLRTKQIGRLRPGRHGDGGTLYLVVEQPPSKSRHWTQRLVVNGKRRDIGLGGWPYVGLAEARKAAFANRQSARRGGDPVARVSRVPTFGTACNRAVSQSAVIRAWQTATATNTTIHGLRSSFRTWAAERSNATRDIAEMALAHRVGSDTERSYARSDLVEKRRTLMEEWAAFVTGDTGKVVRMSARR